MLPPHPLPDAYWAGPRLLAGPWPGADEREAQKARLRTLIDSGARCFIDLTAPGEFSSYRIALERLLPSGDESVYVQVPMLNGSAPGEHTARLVLDMIDASIRAERGVYVHCAGGLGRTGTIVGCWMIRHGMVSTADVVAKLLELRQGQPHGDRPSPETPPQHAFLRKWSKDR
jgi:hypothetical protein